MPFEVKPLPKRNVFSVGVVKSASLPSPSISITFAAIKRG
jgi:hypothetical protein